MRFQRNKKMESYSEIRMCIGISYYFIMNYLNIILNNNIIKMREMISPCLF